MAGEIPVVRVFIGCEELEYDSDSWNSVTLRRLFHRIQRLAGEPFPCVREQMALYALLTNGRGIHRFAVGLYFLDEGAEATIKESDDREIDLGLDPTVVFGLPVPHMRAIFTKPGQYTFALLCDGQRIAEHHFEVQ